MCQYYEILNICRNSWCKEPWVTFSMHNACTALDRTKFRASDTSFCPNAQLIPSRNIKNKQVTCERCTGRKNEQRQRRAILKINADQRAEIPPDINADGTPRWNLIRPGVSTNVLIQGGPSTVDQSDTGLEQGNSRQISDGNVIINIGENDDLSSECPPIELVGDENEYFDAPRRVPGPSHLGMARMQPPPPGNDRPFFDSNPQAPVEILVQRGAVGESSGSREERHQLIWRATK